MRDRLSVDMQKLVVQQYLENRAATDPLLPQSALRELLQHIQAREQRIVLVIDRFDRFTEGAPTGMTDTLRNFRDSFKDALCYVVGMRQAPKYVLNPDVLGEMYEILDLHICWIGPMEREDARRVISEELFIPEASLDEKVVENVYNRLTGGYPSLLKAVCQRYLDSSDIPPHWGDSLLQDKNVRYRLAEIWQGFTQQEQVILYTLAQGDNCSQADAASLLAKGLIIDRDGYYAIGSTLLRDYSAEVGQFSRGALWEDTETGVLYQGIRSLEDLSPTETALLTFFIQNPYKKHTYTEIIEAVWTEDHPEGVSTETLAQHISGLRKQIEPHPSIPTYIINLRGRPEGYYQCFPEGKPA
jgi:hypothetical protein